MAGRGAPLGTAAGESGPAFATMTSVRKAVIPAAGLGTRFLPATRRSPRRCCRSSTSPAIQYVVEEAVRAGIDDILIITGRGKRSLEDHFDRSIELEASLDAAGKLEQLDEVRGLAELADIHYVRQGEALGLGHAVSVARKHVGDEPFAVLLGDDIMDERSTVLEEMIARPRAARAARSWRSSSSRSRRSPRTAAPMPSRPTTASCGCGASSRSPSPRTPRPTWR